MPNHEENIDILRHRVEQLEKLVSQEAHKPIKEKRWRSVVYAAALLFTFGSIGLLMAGGIPTNQPLVYSGYLEKDGKPLNGSYKVDYTLYAPNITTATNCKGSVPNITFVKGRFKLPLAHNDCVGVLQQNTEVWLEISVDGTPLTKQKISASPYAVSTRAPRTFECTMQGWSKTAGSIEVSFCYLKQTLPYDALVVATLTGQMNVGSNASCIVGIDFDGDTKNKLVRSQSSESLALTGGSLNAGSFATTRFKFLKEGTREIRVTFKGNGGSCKLFATSLRGFYIPGKR
ncbi:MAG: hypothetical protein EP343_11240 [Deltaproteobacteria bacterium]|nr:MAG: hypothetical protein EP343_11240 [Deltaproteobacteria bacterium]